MPTPVRYIVGCMTGTSLDGLDVVLMRVEGTGLSLHAAYLGSVHRPMGDLAETLRSMASGEAHPPINYMLSSRSLGMLHAEAVTELVQRFLPGDASLNLIVAHGQTVWHAPEDGVSWQLFDPMPCVRALRTPVCFNLRQADLVAGGQGAPITPLADWVLYRHPQKHRLVVNLGGIINVTLIAPESSTTQPASGGIEGGDVGPCNILIDGLVRRLFPGKTYDHDGQIAATGTAYLDVFHALEQHPALFGEGHHSLGREDFPDEWFNTLLRTLKSKMSPADIIASAVEAVATMLTAVAAPRAQEMILAGGATHNPVLVERIKALSPFEQVLTSDEVGLPVEAREAAAFAVLGALSQDGVPITLPSITGASHPGRAGMWVYP
jgi:1,6-anhydro-N-acetylmuramate kinase